MELLTIYNAAFLNKHL